MNILQKIRRWLLGAGITVLIGLVGVRIIVTGLSNYISWALLYPWQQVGYQVGIPSCKTYGQFPRIQSTLDFAANFNQDLPRNRSRLLWLQGNCTGASELWQGMLSSPSSRKEEFAAAWLLWLDAYDQLPKDMLAKLSVYADAKGQMAERQSIETAMEWYHRSLLVQPNLIAADHLSVLYTRMNDKAAAISVWQKLAQQFEPAYYEYWWAKGREAEITNKWEDAATSYSEAAQLTSDPYDALIHLGQALRNLRDWNGAEGAYEQALRLRPNVTTPYLALGHMAITRENYDSALDWFSRASLLKPDSAEPYYLQGWVYCIRADFEKAETYFTIASRRNPKDPTLLYYWAWCRFNAGDLSRAIETMNNAIQMHRAVYPYAGQPWGWALNLGDWYLAYHDISSAKDAYSLALAWHPGDQSIQERIKQIK